jgi:hypothetical protein
MRPGLRLGLALAAVTSTAACAEQPAEREGAIVGDDVVLALEHDDAVSVVIMLATPSSLEDGGKDTAVVRRDIARIQDQVLASLTPTEFALKSRYENVPAIVGRVTAAGLEKLKENSLVVRVDLDVGGRGAEQQVQDDKTHDQGDE